jgi:hypothetical protein
VIFEVLTAVKMSMLFWVVTPCGLVGRDINVSENYTVCIFRIYLQEKFANPDYMVVG